MKKTKFSIMMNYEIAIKKAESLDNFAKELSVCISNATNERSQIKNCWQDDNVQTYLTKMDTCINNIKQTEKYVLNISNAIRRIAKRNYDSEMKALEISQKRTYK